MLFLGEEKRDPHAFSFSLQKFIDCDDCVLKKKMRDMNKLTFTHI